TTSKGERLGKTFVCHIITIFLFVRGMMSESQHFKDYLREARLFQRRVLFMLLVMVLMLGGLAYRYHHLQVDLYQHYATQSDRNRVHIQPVPPTRGLIYDRQGILLADNRPT